MSKVTAPVSEERTRLLKAQADAQEMKNAHLRGEMVLIADVERDWSSILRVVRSGMLALSSRVAQRLPALTRSDKTVIDQEVRAILEELAAYEFGSVAGDGGSKATSEPTAIDLD